MHAFKQANDQHVQVWFTIFKTQMIKIIQWHLHSPTRSKYTSFMEYYLCALIALPRFALECDQKFDDNLYSFCQFELMLVNKDCIYCTHHINNVKRGHFQRTGAMARRIMLACMPPLGKLSAIML